MDFKSILNKLKGNSPVDHSILDNEIITSLVKMKQQLYHFNENNLDEHSRFDEYFFKLDSVLPNLKAVKVISKKLTHYGFRFKLDKYIEKNPNQIFWTYLTVTEKHVKIFNQEKLKLALDAHLQELGISLDIVNDEITKDIPSYPNIINSRSI